MSKVIVRFSIVEIDTLRGHEALDNLKLKSLRDEIENDGILKRPIVVDEKTYVVLDGHHRIGALRQLGCSKIPVYFVNYLSPKIGVEDSRSGEELPKDVVIKAGLSGNLLPPKSTWHYITFSEIRKHISHIQRRVDIPLKNLK